MTNTELEQLRNFAVSNGQMAFAHLVTAAINGEEWAMERVHTVIARISVADGSGLTLGCTDEEWLAYKLSVIRATNTTRPDGATAKSLDLSALLGSDKAE